MPTSICRLTILLLLATSADASAEKKCVLAGDASVAAAKTASATWTTKSYDKTLRKRGLTRAKLGSASLQLHRGYRPAGEDLSIPYDKASVATVNGVKGVFIGGMSSWSGSAGTPQRWEFVGNSKGEIFRVVRDPQFRDQQVRLCGCAPHQCPAYGSGCPACGSTSQLVYGPLPKGAVYRGELRIAYPARRMALVHAKGPCPPRRCPAPPPSMAR